MDEALADAIRQPARYPELRGHLPAFASDVPAALIWGFEESYGLDDETLSRLYDAVDVSCGPHSERLRRLLAGRRESAQTAGDFPDYVIDVELLRSRYSRRK